MMVHMYTKRNNKSPEHLLHLTFGQRNIDISKSKNRYLHVELLKPPSSPYSGIYWVITSDKHSNFSTFYCGIAIQNCLCTLLSTLITSESDICVFLRFCG